MFALTLLFPSPSHHYCVHPIPIINLTSHAKNRPDAPSRNRVPCLHSKRKRKSLMRRLFELHPFRNFFVLHTHRSIHNHDLEEETIEGDEAED